MKKITAFVMTIVCMLSLVSCGKSGNSQVQQQMEDKTDVTFEGKNMELKGVKGTILSYTVKNGTLYVLTNCEADEDQAANPYEFYSLDLDGSNAQCISSQASGKENIVAFCVDSTGNIIYISVSDNSEDWNMELVKINNDGKELLRENITKIIRDDAVLISGIVSDSNGVTALACGQKVYFLMKSFSLQEKCGRRKAM